MAKLPPPPQPTVTAIYAAYEAAAEDGFRDHLGASLLGKVCARAPARLSDDPAFFECHLCDHRDVCYEGEAAPQTCRSCLHSTPLVEGGWHCARWDRPLDRATQRTGCDHHLFVPDLVPSEPVAAGEDRVFYRMPDGDFWTDGPGVGPASC